MGYSVLSKYRSELMGLAMLWILFYHTWGLQVGNGVLALIKSTGFGGVDIFILLSAMGLVMSLRRREQRFAPFMMRRLERILPAYYVVFLPYAALALLRGKLSAADLLWNASFLAYWVQADWIFNWYIPGLLLFYALTPACFRLLKNSRHRTLLTALGVLAALALCQLMMGSGIWLYLDVVYRIPVFFLGLLMGFYVSEERTLGRRDAAVWCLAALCGAGYYLLSRSGGVGPLHFPLCHLFLFTTVPLCLLAGVLFERLPLGGLRRPLRWIGESSLEIYMLNVCFVWEAAFLQRYLCVGPGLWGYYLITTLLNLVLGILLHLALTWCIGKWKGRKTAQ